jgi:ABC-type branched-subunit amino acid transport system ATPase component
VTLAVAQRRGEGASPVRNLRRSEAVDEAHDLLAQLGLGDDMLRPTRELAYGRQRLVEIALGLAAKPKVLLLDEPAAGVPEAESAEIFRVIESLPSDVAVLFIEHDVDLVFRFARHITVLVSGRIFREGTPDEIALDPEVRRVYLGGVAG